MIRLQNNLNSINELSVLMGVFDVNADLIQMISGEKIGLRRLNIAVQTAGF